MKAPKFIYLVPLVLLGVFASVLVFNWTEMGWSFKIMMCFAVAFLCFVSFGSMVILVKEIKTSKYEKLANRQGELRDAKLVTYFEQFSNSTSHKGAKPVRLNLKFYDDQGEVVTYIPSRVFSHEQLEYLQSKEFVKVKVYKNCCVVAEDFSLVQTKEHIIHSQENYSTDNALTLKKCKKDITLSAVIVGSIYALVIFCLVYAFSGSSIAAGALAVFSIPFLILLIITTKRYNCAKFGRPAEAETFSVYITRDADNSGYSRTISFDFVDEFGLLRRRTVNVSGKYYKIAQTIEHLPIFVYKKMAIINYDALTKKVDK